MEDIKTLLKHIATEWSNSDRKEAVEAAALLKDVLDTPPVDKAWDDPQGIRCPPPDLPDIAKDNNSQGLKMILDLIK